VLYNMIQFILIFILIKFIVFIAHHLHVLTKKILFDEYQFYKKFLSPHITLLIQDILLF